MIELFSNQGRRIKINKDSMRFSGYKKTLFPSNSFHIITLVAVNYNYSPTLFPYFQFI
jgi:hypothetical protein